MSRRGAHQARPPGKVIIRTGSPTTGCGLYGGSLSSSNCTRSLPVDDIMARYDMEASLHYLLTTCMLHQYDARKFGLQSVNLASAGREPIINMIACMIYLSTRPGDCALPCPTARGGRRRAPVFLTFHQTFMLK